MGTVSFHDPSYHTSSQLPLEGAGIWLWLLTSQSGCSELCLKGLSAISAAEKPGEPGEATGALIYIRARE